MNTIIRWLKAAWLWLVTTQCVRCEKTFYRKHTHVRVFEDGRFCTKCLRAKQDEEHEEHEAYLLNEETRKQRRILEARARAERELSEETDPYRDRHP